MSQFHIRRVAVLGAGVMGAQIAAHLVNARIPVRLYDLPSPGEADQSAIANRANADLFIWREATEAGITGNTRDCSVLPSTCPAPGRVDWLCDFVGSMVP